MRFFKKMILTGLVLFSSFLMLLADDTGSVDLTQKVSIDNEQRQKLNESLKETDLEIKIRQKIERELQDKEELTNSPVEEKNKLQEKQSCWYIALMYLPNRMIDLSDIITINGGVGPEASLEVTFTKWGQFGGSYGDRYFIEKGFNRQCGGGYSSGYNGAFICWGSEEQIVDYVFGTVRPYVNLNENNSSIPCPYKEPYKGKVVDFWRIGLRAGWIIDFGFDIHPTAIANFFTGFCFVRLTNTNDL